MGCLAGNHFIYLGDGMKNIVLTLIIFGLMVGVASGALYGNITLRNGSVLAYQGGEIEFNTTAVPSESDVWAYSSGEWNPTAISGVSPAICQGRLTLESGVPISTSDQTAKTEVYLTPYNGNWIGIYDGADWGIHTFAEIGISTTEAQTGTTTDTTYNITGLTNTEQLIVGMAVTGTGVGADAVITEIENSTAVIVDVASTATGENTITFKIPASTNVDIFTADDSGVELRFGPLWTDGTTRATALTTQDGIYVLDGTATYRYLGTIRTTTTAGQIEDSEDARFIWNMYNRVERRLSKIDTTDSWAYTTATWRSWNNAATNRVEIVQGLNEELAYIYFEGKISSTSAVTAFLGIGIDSTSANSATIGVGATTAANTYGNAHATYRGYVGVGYHYVQLLERGNTGCTFYGDVGLTGVAIGGAVGYVTA